MGQIVLDRLAASFGGAGKILASGTERGDEWARVRRDAWVEVATFLRDDPATKMEMFIDLTCVDRFGGGGPGTTGPDAPRFDVVVHLYSVSLKHRIRLYAGAPEEDPTVDTLIPVWAGADWSEFVGHPLRKDYPKEKRQPLIRRQGMGE
jgi:NADH-quinone oxidoreductase subunit C